MSKLSALESRLSECKLELEKVNDYLNNKIPVAEKAYSNYTSESSYVMGYANTIEASIAINVNRPLSAGCSGTDVERIRSAVSSIGSDKEYVSNISNLDSDVSHAYSDLEHAKSNFERRASELKEKIIDLKRQISEEKKRLANEGLSNSTTVGNEGDIKKYEY